MTSPGTGGAADARPLRRTTLADGLELYYLNLEETRFVHDEIFVDQTYLRHGIALTEGAVVVDVGANIGMFALYVHRRVPGARIIAFEPVPDVFAVLEANAALHAIDTALFPCALGAAAGEATFTFYPNNSVMSGLHADDGADRQTTRTFLGNKNPTLFAGAEATPALGRHVDAMFTRLFKAQTFRCPIRTLSDCLAEAAATRAIDAIDLLKIDVEKAELDVIAGIAAADWPKIRQIVIEVHDRDGRLAKLTQLLSERGFTIVSEQDPVLAGTEIWTLYGRRT